MALLNWESYIWQSNRDLNKWALFTVQGKKKLWSQLQNAIARTSVQTNISFKLNNANCLYKECTFIFQLRKG